MRIEKSENSVELYPLMREDLVEGNTYLSDYWDLEDVDVGLMLYIGTKSSGKNTVYQLVNLSHGVLMNADKSTRFRSVEAHIVVDET